MKTPTKTLTALLLITAATAHAAEPAGKQLTETMFQMGYREGFARGFESGVQSAQRSASQRAAKIRCDAAAKRGDESPCAPRSMDYLLYPALATK